MSQIPIEPSNPLREVREQDQDKVPTTPNYPDDTLVDILHPDDPMELPIYSGSLVNANKLLDNGSYEAQIWRDEAPEPDDAYISIDDDGAHPVLREDIENPWHPRNLDPQDYPANFNQPTDGMQLHPSPRPAPEHPAPVIESIPKNLRPDTLTGAVQALSPTAPQAHRSSSQAGLQAIKYGIGRSTLSQQLDAQQANTRHIETDPLSEQRLARLDPEPNQTEQGPQADDGLGR